MSAPEGATPRVRRPLGAARLRALSLADQVIFSVANFVLTIALARAYLPADFAGYGIGLSIALVIQSIQRNSYVVTTTLMPERRVRRLAGALMGEHLLVLGFVVLSAGAALALLRALEAGPMVTAIIVATATTGLIYFQSEFDRVMQIKHDRPWDPVATSLAFLLVNLGLGAAAALLQLPFLGFMAGLCAFCALKGLWLVATIARPRFRQGWRLLVRDLRGKMGWASLGAVAYGGYNHAPIFILGATAAPIHTAGFVAMRSLMQPLQVIIRSLDVVDKHLFGKASGASRSGMKRVFLRTLAIYGGFGALVALVVFVAGDAIVSLAYGAKYEGFHFTLVGWAVASMVMVMTAPIESVVFTAGRMRGYMSQRLIAGVVGVTAAAVLCPLFQDRGAIVATLIGWLVALGAGLWLALSILRRPAEEDAP